MHTLNKYLLTHGIMWADTQVKHYLKQKHNISYKFAISLIKYSFSCNSGKVQETHLHLMIVLTLSLHADKSERNDE